LTIAMIIREYRLKHGLVREALAGQIGVSEGRIGQLERGSLPTMPMLKRLATFFGWEATYIGQLVIAAKGKTPGPTVRRGRVGRAIAA